MSWLLEEEEEDHCRRRRRRSVWSAYRWILIRVVSKIKKKAAVQPQNQQTVSQLIIQIVGFGLKNKKVVRCTAAIFTLLYLSLFGTYPYAPARPRVDFIVLLSSRCNFAAKNHIRRGRQDTTEFKVCFLLSVALYPVWLPCDTTPN